MPNDSETLPTTSDKTTKWVNSIYSNTKIRAICQYFVICPKINDCLHAQPHIPIYKGHSGYAACATCIAHAGLLWGCPANIPTDRCCFDLNAEEIIRENLKNNKK